LLTYALDYSLVVLEAWAWPRDSSRTPFAGLCLGLGWPSLGLGSRPRPRPSLEVSPPHWGRVWGGLWAVIKTILLIAGMMQGSLQGQSCHLAGTLGEMRAIYWVAYKNVPNFGVKL